MTGGGFGGSAIALVPDARVAAVEQAVLAAFDAQGLGPAGVPDRARRAPAPAGCC